MGGEIGGYREEIEWPKLGGAMVIAACLIVAIRTAKWPSVTKEAVSDRDLDNEVDFALYVASRVLSAMVSRKAGLFPTKRIPWYQPNEEDMPK